MKYEGTKAFQLYREVSVIKANLVFESDSEDELRKFLTARKDLGGCVFRQFIPEKGWFEFRKLRPLRTRRPRIQRIENGKLKK